MINEAVKALHAMALYEGDHVIFQRREIVRDGRHC